MQQIIPCMKMLQAALNAFLQGLTAALWAQMKVHP
jgi:hypothetical protein